MSGDTSGHVDDQPVSSGEASALFAGLTGERRLLAAISGGPDSVALLALLVDWAAAADRPELFAATVDHGLRPGSAAEADAVAELCRRLSVPHAVLRWDGPKPVSGIQERARQARYDLLAREAERIGGALLVSAHTLDDQAETLMMRLARGSGPSGLAAMRARVRKGGTELARPLLAIPKTRLIATVKERGLGFAQDPSNSDSRFERVRWRALMPLLAREGLTAERLALLAARLARMEAALEHRVAGLMPAPGGDDAPRLDLAALAAEPEEIVLRVVGRMLQRAAPEGAAGPRLERLEACVREIVTAARQRTAITRTLSGCVLTLDRRGVLTLAREAPRRRGVHPAAR